MDFFGEQDRRRRRTALLVALFCLAVASIVAAIYAPLAWAQGAGRARHGHPAGWWYPDLLLWVASGVTVVVGGAALYMWSVLAGGGGAVARRLGGRRIDDAPADPDERRLRNVVEEMAIASGTPVPEVYVLDAEPGINAFAAGHSTSDAAVAVTRGSLRVLSRDELQGVIAHEFSHVLNGDMTLNMNLLGVVFGIQALALLGVQVLRLAPRALRGGRRARGGGAGAVAAIFAFGLLLTVVGYLGLLFGRLIQAAVSREREYLADASAVQFSRNPRGLGGALKKIGARLYGSRLLAPRAGEASHMTFADALYSAWLSAFATHPPIERRILLVEPSWDGSLPPATEEWEAARAAPAAQARLAAAPAAGAAAAAVAGLSPAAAPAPAPAIDAGVVVSRAGNPGPAEVAFAHALIEALPEQVALAVHDPAGARAALYALLLDARAEVRARQMAFLREHAPAGAAERAAGLAARIEPLGPGARLPLLDLSMPALRALPPGAADRLCEELRGLALADREVSLREYAILRLARHHLDRAAHPAPPRAVHGSMPPLHGDCALLLSALARLGAADAAAAGRSFADAARSLGAPGLPLAPAGRCTPDALDAALARIERATPQVKRRVVDACARAAASDGALTAAEAEVLRAVCDALGVPIPPLVCWPGPG